MRSRTHAKSPSGKAAFSPITQNDYYEQTSFSRVTGVVLVELPSRRVWRKCATFVGTEPCGRIGIRRVFGAA